MKEIILIVLVALVIAAIPATIMIIVAISFKKNH